MIGAAGDHRRAGGKPRRRGGLGGDAADDLMGGADRRQQAGLDTGLGEELGREFAPADIHQTQFQRPIMVDAAHPRQAVGDVVIGAEDGGDAGDDLGLVMLEPAQFRGHDLLVDAAAGGGEEGRGIDARGHGIDLRQSPGIVLLHAPAQHPALGIQQHHRRHHPGCADGRDIGAGQLGLLHELGDDGAAVGPPLVRILLRPIGLGRMQIGRPFRLRQRATLGIDQDADGRGGADIDAEKDGHGRDWAPNAAGGRDP